MWIPYFGRIEDQHHQNNVIVALLPFLLYLISLYTFFWFNVKFSSVSLSPLYIIWPLFYASPHLAFTLPRALSPPLNSLFLPLSLFTPLVRLFRWTSDPSPPLCHITLRIFLTPLRPISNTDNGKYSRHFASS